MYWTYGYSPVFDEHGGVGGTLVVCTETTSRVIGQRRLRTLRNLAETNFGVGSRAVAGCRVPRAPRQTGRLCAVEQLVHV